MGMVEVARDFLGNLFSFDQAHPLLFTQFYFWAFFALVLAMLCVFRNKILLRNACLFAVSLFFYYKTSGLFLLLLLFVVAFNYLAGLLIPRIRGKGWRKAVLSDGHILLEGVPGLAKTLAIRTLSQLLDGEYSRIQFTPDLLPADLIGTQIYSQRDEQFRVKRGPVFANFVLADEINRAPAKVQSALLEAMQEHQVTIGEETHQLPAPFLVMATQNPIEQEGTYPLPEAQLDRFMLKVVVGYPTLEEEKRIVEQNLATSKQSLKPVASLADIEQARAVVEQIYIDEKILHYIAQLVQASRQPALYAMDELVPMIAFGCSPRASISLAKASKAFAMMKGRGYVVPEDVRQVAHDVMRHRIGLTYEAEANGLTSDDIVSKILNSVEVP